MLDYIKTKQNKTAQPSSQATHTPQQQQQYNFISLLLIKPSLLSTTTKHSDSLHIVKILGSSARVGRMMLI